MGDKSYGYLDSEIFLDAINSAKDGWFYTDEKGVIIYCNNAYEKMTNISRYDLIGKSVYNLIDHRFPISSMTIKVNKTKKEVSEVIQYNDKNADEIFVTVSPVINEENMFLGTVGNVRNLTQMSMNRESLSLIESNEIKMAKESLAKKKRELDIAIENSKDTNRILEEELDRVLSGLDNNSFTGRSKHRYDLINKAYRLSKVDSPVLITGETGVGKDVFANMVHNFRAKSAAIIKISCAALPENLIESELFGYEAGAFTGAKNKGKKGLFELANNGTIFLDEIGELPISMQVKLLTALQDKEFYRVGGSKTIKLNARIISATNRDLKEEVKQGKFREDLYYRLNVIPVHILPLRDRPDDIFPIMKLKLDKLNKIYSKKKRMDPELVKIMEKYYWPGNIRQLNNVMERIYVLSDKDILDYSLLPKDILDEYTGNKIIDSIADKKLTLEEYMNQCESNILTRALDSKETLAEISENLDISLSTLHRKIKKHDIKRKN